jgi:hypothetical protein
MNDKLSEVKKQFFHSSNVHFFDEFSVNDNFSFIQISLGKLDE